MTELVDATAPEDIQDDIDDDGIPLFEKQTYRREKSLYFDAPSNVRHYLRLYSLVLVFLNCLPFYYSIVYCQPIDQNLFGPPLINPAFNKYRRTSECLSINNSFQSGLLAISIYFGLKIYNKVLIFLFYLCLLFYFGSQVRYAKLQWAINLHDVTQHETNLNYIDLSLITFQTVSIFPFLFGIYYLLRRVHRKSTKEEIALRNKIRVEESRLLKKRMKEIKDLEEEAEMESEEQREEEEKERRRIADEDKVIKKRLARIHRMEKDINEREKERNQEREKKRKASAVNRKNRRQASIMAAECDD